LAQRLKNSLGWFEYRHAHVSEHAIARALTRCQFHQHFIRAFFIQKFVQSQKLTREKLLKRLSYKKCARKMLMKLTQGPQSLAHSVESGQLVARLER